VVLICQGRNAEAIENIKRALDLGPESYLRWANLGTAYRRARLVSQSQLAYRRGLELAEEQLRKNPRDARGRSVLAYLCAQLGERQRSESEIGQAVQQSPNDADTVWWAALTYETLGRRSETLSVLAAMPRGPLAQLSHWPDVAELLQDSRFLQLLAARAEK